MTAPQISVRNGSRTLGTGQRILKDLDLQVLPGESVAIVGKSGSGKSTLLGCLGLIAPFDAGTTYRIGRRAAQELTEREANALRAQRIGFVFQNAGLVPHLTALENVQVPFMHRRDVGMRDGRRRALAALESVELGPLAKRLPKQLSGGERQRVAIARAMVVEPALILADEPTGALDQATGKVILDVMFAQVKKASASLLIVTHDHDVAARADRVLRIQDGMITAAELM